MTGGYEDTPRGDSAAEGARKMRPDLWPLVVLKANTGDSDLGILGN